MRAAALAIRFGLELCILASMITLAAALPVPSWMKALLALLFCVIVAAIWGALLSPKRRYEIGAFGRLFLEGVLFVGSAVTLRYVGSPGSGIALLVVAVADRIALAWVTEP